MPTMRKLSSTLRFWLITATVVGSPVVASGVLLVAALLGAGDVDVAEAALTQAVAGSVAATLVIDGFVVCLRKFLGRGVFWWVLAPVVQASLMVAVWGMALGEHIGHLDMVMAGIGVTLFLLNLTAFFARLRTLARFADGI